MDPQVIADLKEQLSQLGDAMSRQTAALTGLSKTMSTATAAINNTTTKTTQTTTVQNLNTSEQIKTAQSLNPLARSQKEASSKLTEASNDLKSGLEKTGDALRKFRETLLNSQEGFGKYGGALAELGDAVGTVTKSFGLLGGLFGGLVSLGGQALGHMAKQADAVGDATDSISKMGAANSFTMDQVRQMGANARLTSFELEKLIKPMQSVKGGLVGLGGTQAQGIKKFAEVANFSKDLRSQFRRLGMDDQDRHQAIANYITTMNKRGAAFDGTLSSQKGLQKAAVEYTKNLYELADITGESVEDEQKIREQQMDTMEVALQENKWRQETIAAEQKARDGSPEQKQAAARELARIANEKKGFEQLNNDLRQANLTQEQKQTVQRAFLTGQLDQSASSFTVMGMSLTDYLALAHQNRLRKGQLAQAVSKAGQSTLNTIGLSNLATNKEARDAIAVGDKETLKTLTKMSTKNKEIQAAKAASDINNPANKNDPAQKARDLEVETLTNVKLKLDAFEFAHNPFLGNGGKILDTFKDLGLAAAAALGLVAVFKGGQALAGIAGLFGGGGTAGAVGAADEALSGITGNAAGLKQDANGRWRDAKGRFAKAPTADISEESGSALKQAGQSFKDVVKGGTALGLALAAMGAGLAGAVWIVGKALPILADGFKSFKKVDGKNLVQVGLGASALGVGIVAMAGGTAMQALGNIAKFVTGGKSPIEEATDALDKLQKYNLDKNKIRDNGDALIYFAKAMAQVSVLEALGSIGDTFKSISNALVGALGGSTEPPYKQMEDFSKLEIDPKRTQRNSKAFVYFSEAMESYKGGQGLFSAVSTIAGAKLNSLFNQDSAVDAFATFAQKDFGSKASANAKAFLDFSRAMGLLSGGSNGTSIFGSLLSGAEAVGSAVVGAVVGAAGAVASALGFGKVVEAGPGYTTVQDSTGKIVKRTGARNWRNNNPGNLNYGEFAKQHRAIGTDGRFAVFPTYQDGRKAKESLLFEGKNYKDLSITNAISRYAPPSENNTANYINTVSKAAGVPPSTPLSALNPSQRQSMLSAMEKVEGFKVGKEEVLKARKGGIFTGPSTGYPMELHGTEMVIPQMKQDSILTKLAKSTSDIAGIGKLIEATQNMSENNPIQLGSVDSVEFLNPQMIAALANKFDMAIEILQSSDHVQENYLKHISI